MFSTTVVVAAAAEVDSYLTLQCEGACQDGKEPNTTKAEVLLGGRHANVGPRWPPRLVVA